MKPMISVNHTGGFWALQLLPVFAILTAAHGDWSDLSKLSPFR